MSQQTFIGKGVPYGRRVEYCVRPNQMWPRGTAFAQKEKAESRILEEIGSMPAFSYVYFDDDQALTVGLRADRPQDHAATLKQILRVLAQIGIHNPRPGLDTKMSGLA